MNMVFPVTDPVTPLAAAPAILAAADHLLESHAQRVGFDSQNLGFCPGEGANDGIGEGIFSWVLLA